MSGRTDLIFPMLKTSGNEGIQYLNTFWEDLRFPSTTTRVNPTTSKPDYGSFVNTAIKTLLFDKTNEEAITAQIQTSHSAKVGGRLVSHIHFAPMDSGSGTVNFKLTAYKAEINAKFTTTASYTSTITANITANSEFTHLTQDFDDLPVAANVSCMYLIELRRMATSDSYNNDVALLEFDVHYEIDAPGSKEKNSK